MWWPVVAKNTSQNISQLHKQLFWGPDGQERFIRGDRYTGAHVILPAFHRTNCCSWVTVQANQPAANRQQIWHIKNLCKCCQRHCTLEGASKVAVDKVLCKTTNNWPQQRQQILDCVWTPSGNTSGMYYEGYSTTKITHHTARAWISPQEALR